MSSTRSSSYWRKLRQALLFSSSRFLCTYPRIDQLTSMSSLSVAFADDLHRLTRYHISTRNFEHLYEQSFRFHTFQSYVAYQHLIRHVYRTGSMSTSINDCQMVLFNHDYTVCHDLRLCQCVDYIFTVYMKLIEYHSHLYDMYDRRDVHRAKQFDCIMFYRTAICYLLLREHAYQRLLVELDHGRTFLRRYETDTSNHDNASFRYQSNLLTYTYRLFEAIVLQQTKSMSTAISLCEQSLIALNNIYRQFCCEQAEIGSISNKVKRSLVCRHE
jgi:hypothetical protein